MSSGWNLFVQAETFYAQNDIDKTFEYYQKAIKKIVKDENITAQMPIPSGSLPDNTFPTETLGAAWRNFIGFFKDPAVGKTKENSPDAYKLLYSYRPNYNSEHPRFRTDKAKLYLKGMQITAGLTLGLLAWDGKDRPAAMKRYQKAIKKIVKDENITAQMPIPSGSLPDNTFPTETLGAAWRNFIGFFKDPAVGKTKENSPDAYKLLYSYRPNSNSEHPRFRTDKAKLYLKGMQITAGLTLGLLAWDGKDRPAAMKRYREALDLAATHPPYCDIANALEPWDRFICKDVEAARDNLAILFKNDHENAQLLKMFGIEGGDTRKEVLGSIGYVRYEADGKVTFERNVVIASDACAACEKRDMKLQKCSRCKKVSYCGPGCQRAHWKKHKPVCVST